MPELCGEIDHVGSKSTSDRSWSIRCTQRKGHPTDHVFDGYHIADDTKVKQPSKILQEQRFDDDHGDECTKEIFVKGKSIKCDAIKGHEGLHYSEYRGIIQNAEYKWGNDNEWKNCNQYTEITGENDSLS